MDNLRLFKRLVPMVLTAAVAGVACVDDNPTGNVTPPEPRLDTTFLGYSNPDTKQTTCGNCHTSMQRTWLTTGHANAWQDLQASGGAGPACYGCHTVSGLTSPDSTVPDSAGYFAVAADAKKFYQDVQCESCHGPGATHVTAPDESQPLSTIVAGVGATKGCATCHNGTHHPFVEEWSRSPHDTVFTPPTGVRATTGDGPYCRGCHTGQGALARFDPRARYQEMNAGIPGVVSSWQPITCVVCHDPHGTDNPANLRFPVNTPDLSTNLCMQCHNRRASPDMTSESSGPHTPQGPMLLGEAGWVPPGLQVSGVSSHGSDANPDLCAGCHVNSYAVNDPAGNFLVQATGHTFEPIPCADANGYPDSTVSTCAPTARTFAACTKSGCHATQDAARNAWLTSTARLDALVRTLWVDADGDRSLDAFPADSGLLARVKLTSPTEFKNNDGILTVAEGSFFNARMPSSDLSGGAHNPFYEEALLIATTQALRAQYTYLPAPPASEERYLAARRQALGMNR